MKPFKKDLVELIQRIKKIGYKCLPNMGAHVSKHNNKILRNSFGKKSAPHLQNVTVFKARFMNAPSQGPANRRGSFIRPQSKIAKEIRRHTSRGKRI